MAAQATPALKIGTDIEIQPELDLSTGLFFESNLALPESNEIIAAQDTGLHTRFDAGLNIEIKQNVSLNAGVSAATTEYFDQKQFNLNTTLYNAAANYQLDSVTVGLATYQVNVDLANTPYLTIKQWTPSISGRVDKHFFLYGDISNAELEFNHNETTRRTKSNIRSYFLIDSFKHYILLSLAYQKDNAQNAAFDYNQQTAGLNWVTHRQAPWAEATAQELKLIATIAHQKRNYTSITQVDNSLETNFSAKLALTETLYLESTYSYQINRSTDRALAYNQQLIEFRIGLHW